MNTQQLKERYAEPEIPKCRVCGGELTVQRAGGGPTIWGCTGMIDDPTGERNWIYAEGRSCGDEHYERSRWSDYRQGGDADVIELIDALEAAERERDELRAQLKTANDQRQMWVDHCKTACAELDRRDAAAGEPVLLREAFELWYQKYMGTPKTVLVTLRSGSDYHETEGDRLNISWVAYQHASKTAVLPPETAPDNVHEIEALQGVPLDLMRRCIASDAYNQGCADTIAGGAQPQKPVVLPALLTVEQVMHQSGYDRQYAEGWSSGQASTVHDFIQTLREANIPYEVKP